MKKVSKHGDKITHTHTHTHTLHNINNYNRIVSKHDNLGITDYEDKKLILFLKAHFTSQDNKV